MANRIFGSANDYQIVPEGAHPARLIGIYFCGWHTSTYNGKTEWKEKVGLEYQLAERGENGQILTISETLNLSPFKKATLFGRVKNLIGRDPDPLLDFADLLGKACLVSVIHREVDGSVYANIDGTSPLPKALAKTEFPEAELKLIDIKDDPATTIIEKAPKRFQTLLSTGWLEPPNGKATMPAGKMPPSPNDQYVDM